MQAETLAGLMGFGGTLVGAGVSIWATVITQRHQVKTARDQRIEERGRAAGEKALTELYALRRHLIEVSASSTPVENQSWARIAVDHVDRTEAAIALMPGAHSVRERISEAMDIGTRELLVARLLRAPEDVAVRALTSAALEAIDALSAYMRGEGIPEPSQWLLDCRRDGADLHASEDLDSGEPST
ncbi:hypothetical protein ACU639_27090 [Streptomyces cynarae]|uniref:hypothetical protein n=1 Tax=Streptomyces cynarae TaxID=2981134 RepID=UPI00406D3CD9